jgi:hypothetical protein
MAFSTLAFLDPERGDVHGPAPEIAANAPEYATGVISQKTGHWPRAFLTGDRLGEGSHTVDE